MVIFTKMSLTSSPRYRPLIIFSNLQFGEQISARSASGYAASFPTAGAGAVEGLLPGEEASIPVPAWGALSSPVERGTKLEET